MTARRTAVRCLQCGIGLVLAATAVAKLLDLPGFARVLGGYDVFPSGGLLPVAAAVAAAELGLALWLFSGRALARAGAVSAGLHVAYAAWSAGALARGLRLTNCGCFGVFLARPLNRVTVAEDLAMAGLSAALWRLAAEERGTA